MLLAAVCLFSIAGTAFAAELHISSATQAEGTQEAGGTQEGTAVGEAEQAQPSADTQNNAAPRSAVSRSSGQAEVTGITAVVGGSRIDLTTTALDDGADITELILQITQPVTIPAPKADDSQPALEFKRDNFQKQGTSAVTISDIQEDAQAGTVGYTVTVTGVRYAEKKIDVCAFELSYQDTAGGTFKQEFSVDIVTNLTVGSYSLSSARFYSDASTTVSKVTYRRNYYAFKVTIEDSALTKAEFTALDPDHFSIRINSDFITYNSVKIEDIRNWSNNGVSYTVVFSGVRYDGTTNRMLLDVDYNDPFYPVRSFDQVVEGCELDTRKNNDDDDDDDDSSSSKPDIPPPTPNIIISSFDYGGGNVTAARDFSLTVRFTNTSDKLPIDNIVMKATVPEAFTLKGSSNTFYVEKMSRKETVEKTIQFSVKPNAEPISHAIKFDFTFESVISEERKQLSSAEEISIPVAQMDRFTLNPVEVPAEIYVGEDQSFEVTFVNKGKTEVYNVTATISGNISQPGQSQFIGNLESGKEESADFLLGATEEGLIQGEVLITYEDANMNVLEARAPFQANAIMMQMPPMDDMDVMNPDDMLVEEPAWYQKIPVWGWMAGGVVALILLAFIAKVIRAHRDRKLLEEDDEDL